MTAESSYWADRWAAFSDYGTPFPFASQKRAQMAIADAGARGAPQGFLTTLNQAMESSNTSEDFIAIENDAQGWSPAGQMTNPDAASQRSDDPFVGTAQGVKAAAKESGAADLLPAPSTLYVVLAAVVVVAICAAIVAVKLR